MSTTKANVGLGAVLYDTVIRHGSQEHSSWKNKDSHPSDPINTGTGTTGAREICTTSAREIVPRKVEVPHSESTSTWSCTGKRWFLHKVLSSEKGVPEKSGFFFSPNSAIWNQHTNNFCLPLSFLLAFIKFRSLLQTKQPLIDTL